MVRFLIQRAWEYMQMVSSPERSTFNISQGSQPGPGYQQRKVSWTFKNKKRVRLVSLTTGTVENGERVLDLCLLMVFSFSLCLSYFGEGCGVDPIPEGLYDWRALDGWISFV